ncbi:hypothetical protein GCM10010431_27330 [Streptomyces kunmingensis]
MPGARGSWGSWKVYVPGTGPGEAPSGDTVDIEVSVQREELAMRNLVPSDPAAPSSGVLLDEAPETKIPRQEKPLSFPAENPNQPLI